jgi:hypothetical protein
MYNIPVRKRKQTKEHPMTRKDYKAIAAVFKATLNSNVVDSNSKDLTILANSLCIEFKKDNPRFKSELFLEACGVA